MHVNYLNKTYFKWKWDTSLSNNIEWWSWYLANWKNQLVDQSYLVLPCIYVGFYAFICVDKAECSRMKDLERVTKLSNRGNLWKIKIEEMGKDTDIN